MIQSKLTTRKNVVKQDGKARKKNPVFDIIFDKASQSRVTCNFLTHSTTNSQKKIEDPISFAWYVSSIVGSNKQSLTSISTRCLQETMAQGKNECAPAARKTRRGQ